MIKIASKSETVSALMNAVKSGDEKQIALAMNDFQDVIAQKVLEQYEELKDINDSRILAQRGVRQLCVKNFMKNG